MDYKIVNLTENGAKRIAQLQEAADGKIVRLSVATAAGCGGNKYDLAYADRPGPHDEKVEEFGATLYVDPLSLIYVAGTTIDWAEGPLGSAFSYTNPNETGRCGCGESFSCA